MSNTELQSELEAVQSESKSGKMQILGKLNGVSKSATINIHEGEITKIRIGQDSVTVVAKTLSDMSIDSFIFMPSNRIDPSAEADTPNMGTLIKMISGEHKGYSSEELITSAALALSDDMGSGSAKLVKRIAAEFPPTVNPQLFLNKCSEAAADIVGKQHADKLFAQLLEKY